MTSSPCSLRLVTFFMAGVVALAAGLVMVHSFYVKDDVRLVRAHSVYHVYSAHGFLELQVSWIHSAKPRFTARELRIGAPGRMFDRWSNETLYGFHVEKCPCGFDCEVAGFRVALADPGQGEGAILQMPHWALIAGAGLLLLGRGGGVRWRRRRGRCVVNAGMTFGRMRGGVRSAGRRWPVG